MDHGDHYWLGNIQAKEVIIGKVYLDDGTVQGDHNWLDNNWMME